MVDYRMAFSAIRKDPQWKRKLGLGVLITLIPYVGTVWMIGWQMEYQRNVAWGDDGRIPGWSDFSGQALAGLKATVAVLPYSVVLSLFLTPMMMAVPLMGGLLGDFDPATVWVRMAVVTGISLFVVMTLTVLIIPFTSSTILRVALYGTFESGFQFKEIWRLMKAQKPKLMRAWGFTSLNMGISLAAMILYFGSFGLLIVLLPGSSELKAIAILVLGVVGYFGYIVFAMALGLYLGLANSYYFGMYGRAAYHLEEARSSTVSSWGAAQTQDAPPSS